MFETVPAENYTQFSNAKTREGMVTEFNNKLCKTADFFPRENSNGKKHHFTPTLFRLAQATTLVSIPPSAVLRCPLSSSCAQFIKINLQTILQINPKQHFKEKKTVMHEIAKFH